MAAAALFGPAACAHDTVADQTAALTLSPADIARRDAQTRRFDTQDATLLLNATAGVLQDLGFAIDESTASAGLLVASKDRDAVETGQVVTQLALAIAAAAVGVHADPNWERNQKIRVLVVSQPTHDGRAMVVHATFQRVIRDLHGQVSRVLTIEDPKIYQGFFDKLAQAVFLTANQV